MKRIAAAASLVVVSTLAVLGATPAAAQPTRQTVPPDVDVAITLANVADYVRAVEQANVAVYVHAVQMADVQTYVDAVAEADYQTWLASRPSPSPARTTTPSASSSGGGGACGGATNGADQFIHRESGGDPTILNGGAHADSPFNGSGLAFGCYQIMPGTWSGSCSDITTYDPASQAQCASRLGLSAWAL